MTRFSEINPEDYSRLQEAERQMEEASAMKVAAVAADRDAATSQVLALRKKRLLERAFSAAEGRNVGDALGTFFDVFKGQLGESFRLGSGKDSTEVLKPLDAPGSAAALR